MRPLVGAAFLLLHCLLTTPALACHIGQPKSAVILVVEGQITRCNVGLEAQFDLAMLEALPRKMVKTHNPWEPGMATYEGVLLRDLLDFVGANGNVLRIAALNDYRADLNVSDTQSIDVILAYKRNGDYMPVREKGPLFVIFPFTENPALAVEERFSQSVWQVSRITLK